MKGCFVVVRKKGLGRFYTLRGLFPYLGMRSLHSSFLVLKTYRNNDWPLAWLLGKDEVASSNLAISSMNLEHVASMGPGFFCTHFAVSWGSQHLPIVTQDRGEKHREQGYFRRNTDTVHKSKTGRGTSCLFVQRMRLTEGKLIDRGNDLSYDGTVK